MSHCNMAVVEMSWGVTRLDLCFRGSLCLQGGEYNIRGQECESRSRQEMVHGGVDMGRRQKWKQVEGFRTYSDDRTKSLLMD